MLTGILDSKYRQQRKFIKQADVVVRNASIPVVILDEEMKVISYNDKADKYFGLGEEDNFFYSIFEISKADAKEYISNVYSGIENDTPWLVEKKNKYICEISANPVLDQKGNPLLMMVYVKDMTKNHQSMEKLKNMKLFLESQLEDKNRQMDEMTLQTITTLANFIDSKEDYTLGHSTRVAKYSAAIARELGRSEEEATNIYYVGLLHDIGKIGIPYEVLNKPSHLKKDEYEEIKRHTIIGGEILKDIKIMDNVSTGALYHHENYDGTGYPYGLKEDEIPIVARIIGIADSYDAMTSKRQYRDFLDYDAVKTEIEKNSGKQFDPYIASVVLRMIDEGKLKVQLEEEKITVEENILSESSRLMARVLGEEIHHTRKEAEIDYLTQIWNRGTGEKNITQYLKVGDGAFVIIDLDNFKGVNDNYGHQTGDHALKIVAEVLKIHTKGELLCRLGGDEFLLFIRDVTDTEAVKKVLDAILRTYNSEREKSDVLAHTSLSMGVALSVDEGRSFDNLYRCADRALYYVKQNGKRGYSFHNRAELESYSKEDNMLDLQRLANSIKNNVIYEGAYRVEYKQFLHVHEFIEKYAMRNKQGVQLALLTIGGERFQNMEAKEKEAVMETLEKSVTKALRGVDASTRFSVSQILLTLVDTDQKYVDMIVERVLSDFYSHYESEEIIVDFESADITMRAS